MLVPQRAAVSRLLCAAISLGAAVEGEAAKSPRQELAAAVRESWNTTRVQLNQTLLPLLKRKQAAFGTFIEDWKTKMPAHLREKMPAQLQAGLSVDLVAFGVLQNEYDAMESLLKACESVPEEGHKELLAQLGEAAGKIDTGLRSLQERWKERPQARADFKRSLAKAMDLMIEYNVSKAASYIAMKVELDPDNLDLVINYQRTLLIPVKVGIHLLE